MNRIWIAVALAGLCLLPGLTLQCPVAWGGPGDLRRSQTAYAEDAANTSVTVLPAVSGTTYTILDFTLSLGASDTVYLRCGSSQKTAKIYLSANSGLSRSLFPHGLQCASGEAFQVVKGTAGTPLGVTVQYTSDNP